MEKVYLLLRNNVERGPFTRTQLISQPLFDTDLIWVEGVSTSWMTPSELHELEEKKIPQVAMLSTTAVVPTPTHIPPPPKTPLVYSGNGIASYDSSNFPNYKGLASKTPPSFDQNGIDIFIHKKGVRLVSLDQLAGVAFIALVVTTAWFGRHQFFTQKPQTYSAVTPAAFMSEQSFAAKNAILQTEIETTTSFQDTMTATPALTGPQKINAPSGKKNNASNTVINEAVEDTPVQVAKNIEAVESRPEPVKLETTPAIKEETKAEAIKPQPEQIAQDVTVTDEEVKKKKSLGQAIKGIFKKKNKDGGED